MRSTTITLALIALATSLPLPTLCPSPTPNTTVRIPNPDSDKTERSGDPLSDGVAKLLGQKVDVNGTKVDAAEARRNMDAGYSWTGPVYDGELGLIPDDALFDDNPDKPDGPSGIPKGAAEYPH